MYELELSWTNFWQGAAAGGHRHRINYGGKFIGAIKIDGTKAGLIKNSMIKIGGEFRYEDSAAEDIGAAIPVNTALIGFKYFLNLMWVCALVHRPSHLTS